MGRVCLWEPIAKDSEKREPFAELTYGDNTFEIPLTLVHWISGWICMAADKSHVPSEYIQSTKEAFDKIEEDMWKDIL
jgi:hypothetical protein